MFFLSDFTGTSSIQTLTHLDPRLEVTTDLFKEYHHHRHKNCLAMWIGSFSRDSTPYAFWTYDCNLWFIIWYIIIYGIQNATTNKLCTICAATIAIWDPNISEVWGWQCARHETTLSKAHPTYWSLPAVNAVWICGFPICLMAHLHESNVQKMKISGSFGWWGRKVWFKD